MVADEEIDKIVKEIEKEKEEASSTNQAAKWVIDNKVEIRNYFKFLCIYINIIIKIIIIKSKKRKYV
jgi:hypothetical protein